MPGCAPDDELLWLEVTTLPLPLDVVAAADDELVCEMLGLSVWTDVMVAMTVEGVATPAVLVGTNVVVDVNTLTLGDEVVDVRRVDKVLLMLLGVVLEVERVVEVVEGGDDVKLVVGAGLELELDSTVEASDDSQ